MPPADLRSLHGGFRYCRSYRGETATGPAGFFPVVTEPRATTSSEPRISFGPFRLVAAQRLLLEGDNPVRLGSRAFDILIALVERAGEVVSKEALITRAWPATYVEEANL